MSGRVSHAARRTRIGWAGLAALTLALSGCSMGSGLYDTPLPGGADVGDDPITITADFSDVVDLVPQSSVKVENIAVGRVSKIELNPDGRSARVTLLVRSDLDLPEDTSARLQQTSLLGEKYVALVRPDGDTASAGELHEGSNIGLAATSQVAEVEQVLGALSMVLNGGAVGKFQEISHELQQVSAGRPGEIRDFLGSMNVFITSLDSRKAAITDALDGLAALATTLADDKDKIATALEGLSPGMQVLVDQRTQLVSMLESLDRLSHVTVRTLNASQKNMVEDLRLLEPILDNLARSGAALPNSLEILFTFPFTDAVLEGISSDYLNVFVTTNFTTLPAGCAAIGCAWPQVSDGSGAAAGQSGARPPLVDPLSPSGSPSSSASSSPSQDPTASGQPSSSEGATTPSATAGTAETAAPSLLPPTDSSTPGSGQPTIQVPVSPSPSHSPSAESSSEAPTSEPTTSEED